MLLRVDIEETTNHLLVLGMMFLGFTLEELHTRSTQGNGNLHRIILKHQLVWSR